jgi:hypothetical protein
MNWDAAIKKIIQLKQAPKIATVASIADESVADLRQRMSRLTLDMSELSETIRFATDDESAQMQDALPAFQQQLLAKQKELSGLQQIFAQQNQDAQASNIKEKIGQILSDPELKIETLFMDGNDDLHRIMVQTPEVVDYFYDMLERESQTNKNLLSWIIFRIMSSPHLNSMADKLLKIIFNVLETFPLNQQIQMLASPIHRGMALIQALRIDFKQINLDILLKHLNQLFNHDEDKLDKVNVSLINPLPIDWMGTCFLYGNTHKKVDMNNNNNKNEQSSNVSYGFIGL